MECPLWCVLSDRRRHIEHLWRRRLLVTSDERRARRRFLRLMRGFDAEDVDVLRRAVESEGRDARQCAPGPPMDEREEDNLGGGEDSGLIPQIDRPMSMPYLCCKLWRWRELQVDAALHTLDALPWCRFGRVTINNATVSCCNPFHYALWIRADVSGDERTPIPPISNGHLVASQPDEETRTSDGLPPSPPPPPPDEVPSTSDSPSLSIRSPSIHHVHSFWATVTRYERREKILEAVELGGAFAAVGLLATAVHDAQPVCCEWDIRNEVSFSLIRQPTQDVWLYNSGNRSLFVSIIANSKADTLRRLSPGYCVRIHRSAGSGSSSGVTPPSGDSHAIISVGAGWGVGYDRQCAQDTRVRYEISFPPR